MSESFEEEKREIKRNTLKEQLESRDTLKDVSFEEDEYIQRREKKLKDVLKDQL